MITIPVRFYTDEPDDPDAEGPPDGLDENDNTIRFVDDGSGENNRQLLLETYHSGIMSRRQAHRAVTASYADDVNTGAMIALAPANPEMLAVEGGLEVDDIHLTMVFLGDTNQLDPALEGKLLDLVDYWVEQDNTLYPHLTHIAHLGPDEDPNTSVVYEVGGPGIHLMNARLRQLLDKHGVEYSTRWAYRPHISIKYMPRDEAVEDFPVGELEHPIPVELTHARLAWGQRNYYFPFSDIGYAIENARVANVEQPRCPAGSGITSGRFSNAQFVNCNPQTAQLSVTGLDQREANLKEALAGELSTARRKRLEEELTLVATERERRADPNQPEGDPAAGDPVGNPEDAPVDNPKDLEVQAVQTDAETPPVATPELVNLEAINPEGRKMLVEVYGEKERTELSEKAIRERVKTVTDSVAEEFGIPPIKFEMFRTEEAFREAVLAHRGERYGDAARKGNQDALRVMERPFPLAQSLPGRLLLSPRLVADIGLNDLGALRIVHHEAVHRADGSDDDGWTSIGPDLTFVEGATEVLSMEHFARTFEVPNQGRVSYFNETGERVYEDDPLRKMTRKMAYPDRVAEVVANAVTRVGPDREAVLDEIRTRYRTDDESVRNSYFSIQEPRTPVRFRPQDDDTWAQFEADYGDAISLNAVVNVPEPPRADPSPYDDPAAEAEWAKNVERAASLMDWLLNDATARTAAFNPDQPRCPAGSGETSGEFSNNQFINCNPQTAQLSATGLDQREANINEILKGELTAARRKRMEEELRLVATERERRADPNQPEGDPAAGDPVGNPEDAPTEAPADTEAETPTEAPEADTTAQSFVNFDYDEGVESSLKDFRASLAIPGPEGQAAFEAAESEFLTNPRIASLVDQYGMVDIHPVLPEAPFNGAMIRSTGARGVLVREFIAVNASGVEEVPDGPLAGVKAKRDGIPFALDQSLEGIIRHESGHYFDRAAAPEFEHKLSSTIEFRNAYSEGRDALRTLVSEYSTTSDSEAHAELFSLVAHPEYDRSDWDPPESYRSKRPGRATDYDRVRAMLDIIENHYFKEEEPDDSGA